MKVMTVLGTRPEIIKLSPLIYLLDKEFEHVLVHSGQHYSYRMDSLFFKELKLEKPKYNLGVGSLNHAKQTAMILEKLGDVILKENPKLVLVLGDTNTTLATALAAAKMHIKLVHIEAGCRSFNKNMPEEINRIVADHCADYLFAPDEKSIQNLIREGIDKKKIYLTGSLVTDACLRNKKLAEESKIEDNIKIKNEKYVLATIHRAENTDDINILRGIMSAFNELSKKIKIVFLIHPRTKKAIEEKGIILGKGIIISEPLGYINTLKLIEGSRFVITDSGGIQEEAYILNTPCLIAREETEWTRLVESGKNFLAGNTKEGILTLGNKFLDDKFLDTVKKIKIDLTYNVDKNMLSILNMIIKGS